ncbi:MAG: zf-HC2 domain-containing protein [Elusimicrobiota bacterium]
MKCDEIKDLLSPYIDNMLDAKERAIVDLHIKECKDCEKEFLLIKQCVQDIKSLEIKKAPANFNALVNEKLDKIEEKRFFLHTLLLPSNKRLVFGIGTVLALLVISLMINKPSQKMIYKGKASGMKETLKTMPSILPGFTVAPISDPALKELCKNLGGSFISSNENFATIQIPAENYNKLLENISEERITVLKKDKSLILVRIKK